MSSPEIAEAPPNEAPATSYLSLHGLRAWLGSTDHKHVALLHLASVAVVLLLGSAFALVLGLERLRPGADLLPATEYSRVLAAHGVVMVFLVVVPAIPATLGNFVLPLMLGAKNLAFPKLDRAGLWLYWLGSATALVGLVTAQQRSGWTFTEAYDAGASSGSVLWIMAGVLLVAASGLLGGLNVIVSIHTLRTRGLTWMRLPMLAWAAYAASVIAIIAPAPLALDLILAAAERTLHVGIFDPRLGGDPLLFQHLFWFYAHPTIFGSMLWAMGVGTELVGVHARRRIFGYAVLAPLFIALAALSFTQWGVHLLSAGTSVLASSIFSMLALVALVPVTLVLVNWLATLRGGSIAINAPMLFALALLVDVAVWLAASVALHSVGLGSYLRGTSFEVAHLHYGLAGVTLTAFLGGLFHWWPKLTGHEVDAKLSMGGAIGVFLALNLTFAGQFVTGMRGMPRGHAEHGTEFSVLNALSAVGSWALVGSLLLIVVTLVSSLRKSGRAAANPWGGESLEWQTESPPPADNFDVRPVVTRGPYDFARPAPSAT